MSILGTRVVRVEDPRFLTGGGTYIAHLRLEGTVHVTYVRSTVAHARILSVDTTDMSFRTFKLRPDPANEVTYANRDRIIVQELEGLCAPGLAH